MPRAHGSRSPNAVLSLIPVWIRRLGRGPEHHVIVEPPTHIMSKLSAQLKTTELVFKTIHPSKRLPRAQNDVEKSCNEPVLSWQNDVVILRRCQGKLCTILVCLVYYIRRDGSACTYIIGKRYSTCLVRYRDTPDPTNQQTHPVRALQSKPALRHHKPGMVMLQCMALGRKRQQA